MPVKDTQQVISIQQLPGATGRYYWKVKSNNGDCEDEVPIFFELINKEDEQGLVSSLIADYSGGDILHQLKAIERLEKNALIYSAFEHYASLINSNPEDHALLKSYVLFLLSYGFDKEAQHTWSTLNKK